MGIFGRKKLKAGYEQHPDFLPNGDLNYNVVLSFLEQKVQADWYLEIGCRTGGSLTHRKCSFIAVDPEFVISKTDVFNNSESMHFMQCTSDKFFENQFLKRNEIDLDLVFIDGMHLFEFALRDFINSEKHMRQGGSICFHDVVPFNYSMTTRDTNYLSELRRPWTGDVWKTIVILKKYRPDLKVEVLNCAKTGLGVVSNFDNANTILEENYDKIIEEFKGQTLDDFGAKNYFDIIEIQDAGQYIGQ